MPDPELARSLAEKSVFTACLGAAERLAYQYPKVHPDTKISEEITVIVIAAVKAFLVSPEGWDFGMALARYAKAPLTPESADAMGNMFVDTFKKVGHQAVDTYFNPPALA